MKIESPSLFIFLFGVVGVFLQRLLKVEKNAEAQGLKAKTLREHRANRRL